MGTKKRHYNQDYFKVRGSAVEDPDLGAAERRAMGEGNHPPRKRAAPPKHTAATSPTKPATPAPPPRRKRPPTRVPIRPAEANPPPLEPEPEPSIPVEAYPVGPEARPLWWMSVAALAISLPINTLRHALSIFSVVRRASRRALSRSRSWGRLRRRIDAERERRRTGARKRGFTAWF